MLIETAGRWVGRARDALQAARAFRAELAMFRPRRGRVPLPDDVEPLRPLEPILLRTRDGIAVGAWYWPSHNGAAVIFGHGSLGDRRSLWSQARELGAIGYGALLFDWPGHGESGGICRWGAAERGALEAAVDFLTGRRDVRAGGIGILGYSMGGYMAAQMAAVDRRLQAVVLVSTPADPVEQTRYFHRRGGAAAQAGAVWAMRWAGMPLERRPADVVAAIAPRPVLIIQGTMDDAVPLEMARQLYQAAGEPKQLWLVEGAGHGDLPEVARGQYEARVRAFFDETLGVKR